jgi:2'-5' RNA ligase
MNIFLAAELPQEAIQKILEQTEKLRNEYPDFNWVPPENYHVAIYHVGDVSDKKIPLVIEHVENALYAVDRTHAYALAVEMSIDKNIVLYVTLQRNKRLEEMYKIMNDLFEDARKKPYIPHITIGRYKIPSKQQYFHLKRKLANLDVELDFPIHEIHLLQSISRPKNPIYNKVKTFSLQEKG